MASHTGNDFRSALKIPDRIHVLHLRLEIGVIQTNDTDVADIGVRLVRQPTQNIAGLILAGTCIKIQQLLQLGLTQQRGCDPQRCLPEKIRQLDDRSINIRCGNRDQNRHL